MRGAADERRIYAQTPHNVHTFARFVYKFVRFAVRLRTPRRRL